MRPSGSTNSSGWTRKNDKRNIFSSFAQLHWDASFRSQLFCLTASDSFTVFSDSTFFVDQTILLMSPSDYKTQKNTIYFVSGLRARLFFDVVRFSFCFDKLCFHSHDTTEQRKRSETRWSGCTALWERKVCHPSRISTHFDVVFTSSFSSLNIFVLCLTGVWLFFFSTKLFSWKHLKTILCV